jgi:Pyruvate/2-oxoacid:ferredoxin oxidoreductase gamma subunit
MAGALSGVGLLPFDPDDFHRVIKEQFPPEKAAINMKAFDIGYQMTQPK